MAPLVWRATFIDVEEEPEAGRGERRIRARSAPCFREIAADIFADEKTYIKELFGKVAGRATIVGSDSAGSLSVNDVVLQQQPVVSQSGAQLRNGELSSILLCATVKGELDSEAETDAETQEPSSSPSGMFAAKSHSAWPAGNVGSLGHPYVCSRPCLYFATAQCAQGESCDFCHIPHARRPPQLCKNHRALLRDMDCAKIKALLMPLVKSKALGFDSSAETALAVERLAAACGVAAAPSQGMGKIERSLTVAFAGMNVRVLLITLQRVALQGQPAAQAAVDALVNQLRRAA